MFTEGKRDSGVFYIRSSKTDNQTRRVNTKDFIPHSVPILIFSHLPTYPPTCVCNRLSNDEMNCENMLSTGYTYAVLLRYAQYSIQYRISVSCFLLCEANHFGYHSEHSRTNHAGSRPHLFFFSFHLTDLFRAIPC